MITRAGQSQDPFDRAGHEQIVPYLIKAGLIEKVESVTIWTTPFALDTTYLAKSMIQGKRKDTRFPYEKTWLVMIDDHPGANFGHPVRWIFIAADFKMHSGVINENFPPLVVSSTGKEKPVEFRCRNLTPAGCDIDIIRKQPVVLVPASFRNCKYAVLVSGGISSAMNYSRYAQNIKSMYVMLRNAGYPSKNIYVYYADGTLPLDCDNADNDNNDATGNDVTGAVIEDSIRSCFRRLSRPLNSRYRVLFSYFTNHGDDNTGVCLWDWDSDQLQADELYTPDEFASDISGSRFCRHFSIHDQCFSGEFLPVAADGSHRNLVVYASASASEYSWGRQYMARWEQNDITATRVNDMHQDVVDNGNLTSAPGMSEGTSGIGNYLAGKCCCCWWWWRYWYIIIIIIGIGIIIIRYFRWKR
jgi:hypothetical protein